MKNCIFTQYSQKINIGCNYIKPIQIYKISKNLLLLTNLLLTPLPTMRPLNNILNELPRKQQHNTKTSPGSQTSYDYNDEPVGKIFTDKKFTNPLHDILVNSRRTLSRIKIELPQASLNNLNQPAIQNKANFPIFEDKQKTSPWTTSRQTEQNSPTRRRGKVDDDLACHANNILRMAIDSTMMSSMNSVTLQNINSDSFEENANSNGKVPETIEINEEEIRAAISG